MGPTMADRVLASVVIVLGIAVGWSAMDLYVPFQYEPLGPKAFPLFLSTILLTL